MSSTPYLDLSGNELPTSDVQAIEDLEASPPDSGLTAAVRRSLEARIQELQQQIRALESRLLRLRFWTATEDVDGVTGTDRRRRTLSQEAPEQRTRSDESSSSAHHRDTRDPG